jgi:hypothetical protein
MSDQDKTKAAPKTIKTGGRGARFQTAMDEAAAALNASVDFDRRLLRDDARGSQAHARMLAAVGLISADDAKQIVAGLDQVVGEFERGERTMDPALEDVHMNVETRLIELIGDAGRRLHTARSRNDQVATDMRLFALRSASAIVVAIDKARVAICRRAREHAATLLPGYTHLQRAQAITLGHHLLAYAEMLGRDRGRFLDAARRTSECPLGSGALAATSLPIDREKPPARISASPPPRATAWTRFRIAISAPSWPLPAPCWACTCRGWAKNWSCGRPRNSGSCAWVKGTARAARSCRKNATPTSPSSCAPSPAASSAIWSRCSPSARAWPWPTTRTCRKPKSPSTTPSKPRAWCWTCYRA